MRSKGQHSELQFMPIAALLNPLPPGAVVLDCTGPRCFASHAGYYQEPATAQHESVACMDSCMHELQTLSCMRLP